MFKKRSRSEKSLQTPLFPRRMVPISTTVVQHQVYEHCTGPAAYAHARVARRFRFERQTWLCTKKSTSHSYQI